ncbi:hypothetical protein [Bradyrhizobium erythrophlei]|uniref:hypothetical protein n=1 Tax=Bradyrhizobium erythrophlei TaxID=1437360 RepID=UPI0015C542B7|nr:hypothetical protein [Bradyrhizobium erythrophlei]
MVNLSIAQLPWLLIELPLSKFKSTFAPSKQIFAGLGQSNTSPGFMQLDPAALDGEGHAGAIVVAATGDFQEGLR